MRRWLRLGLCLGLLTVALTCSALAATPEYTKDKDGTVNYANGKYTASYTGVTSGNQYALLVVKATKDGDAEPINDDTLMYIDQKEAESETISFDFIPKSTPDCVVLLGGVFDGGTGGTVNSPVTLGTLIGQGATIEVPKANVTFAGTTSPTLALADEAGQEYSFTLGSDGAYSVSGVIDGTYTLTVSKKSHLTYTLKITVENGEVTGGIPAVQLLAGDVNDDNYINSSDISIVLQDYLKPNMENAASNINEDGFVNSLDISAVLGNYLKKY